MQEVEVGLKLGTGFFEIQTDSLLPKASPEPVISIPTSEKAEQSRRVVRNGDDVATLILNASVLLKNDEPRLAQHLLRQSLYLNSHHPAALAMLAKSFDGKSEIQLKTKTFEALVESDYRFETVAGLGHCYYHMGNDEEASTRYHEALSLLTDSSPELFEIYKNLGNICLRATDFDGAEEYYNKAHTQQPRSDVLSVNKGTLALQQGETEEALGQFRAALELNSSNDRAWVGLGLVHNQMGDFILARANVTNAFDLNPQNRTAAQLAAAWAIRDQDLGAAIEILCEYLGHVEQDEELSLLLVHLFCQRNQFVEAELEVERLLLWDPTNERIQKVEQEVWSLRNA